MSICENSYYYFIGALNDQQCNAIIERGLSDMTLTEQKSGKHATDATTFDLDKKVVKHLMLVISHKII